VHKLLTYCVIAAPTAVKYHVHFSVTYINKFISFRECLHCGVLQPQNCVIITEWSRNKSPSVNLVSEQDSTVWFIVCTSPHWHLSVGTIVLVVTWYTTVQFSGDDVASSWQHNGHIRCGNGLTSTMLNDWVWSRESGQWS